ncbi:YhbY family RNA-binding protein [Ruminococcaceae bacterium OttesenSCG-928-O06]|nr:YhbY family RNA-binding protein [Ruminococcaceae bacterium OttesenSCG-928-O06]
MLSSKNRAALRKAANGLSPVFQIGKGGVDAPLIQATADCLAKRELVKLKLLETSPVPAREAAEELAAATGAEVVQVIGRVVVLFLQKKKESAFAEVLKP